MDEGQSIDPIKLSGQERRNRIRELEIYTAQCDAISSLRTPSYELYTLRAEEDEERYAIEERRQQQTELLTAATVRATQRMTNATWVIAAATIVIVLITIADFIW